MNFCTVPRADVGIRPYGMHTTSSISAYTDLEVLPLKFAILGGDSRCALLSGLLAEDGHSVHTYCLEKAGLDPSVPAAGCLQSALYGADWVILPVPAEKKGKLNAPLSAQSLDMGELIAALWPGQTLCGGRLSPTSSLAAVRSGARVYDLMQRRAFTVGNAAITAEGAVQKLMEATPRCLMGSHVLITGWGRIASILAPRLRALGAYVSVAARKSGDRAMAAAHDLGCCSFKALPLLIEDVDFVVNTVPAPVLEEKLLKRLKKDAVLLELASAPGGFDSEAAQRLGLKVIAAPGLPGEYAPISAAELMRESIYAIIAEEEE